MLKFNSQKKTLAEFQKLSKRLFMKEEKIVIIGGGISGLSTAAFLDKNGKSFLLLEKQDQPGGVMRSQEADNFIMDFGSNSAIEKNFAIPELIDFLGLKDEVMYASRASSKRYILKNNKLHALKGPLSVVFTQLFSWKGKFRVIKEIWIKPRISEEDESVANFVERRLGREIVDYAFSPLISGIYAGRPEEISMKANYPKMTALEQNYGSIIKGAIAKVKEKKKSPKEPKPSKNIFSFRKGMQQIALHIASKYTDKIEFNADVQLLEQKDGKYLITYIKDGNKEQVLADKIISAAPAFVATNYFSALSVQLSASLAKVYYPPVIVLNLIYKRTQIGVKLDSFGYLIPEKEKKNYLGAIWSSVVFPNRTPDEYASFTLFIGGSVNKKVKDDIKGSVAKAKSEFEQTMNISDEAIVEKFKLWEKAIPQYNMDYPEIIAEIEKFEKEHPNIIISGNYYKGFATGDCIENAKLNAERME